jgi:hypothetical protein
MRPYFFFLFRMSFCTDFVILLTCEESLLSCRVSSAEPAESCVEPMASTRCLRTSISSARVISATRTGGPAFSSASRRALVSGYLLVAWATNSSIRALVPIGTA